MKRIPPTTSITNAYEIVSVPRLNSQPTREPKDGELTRAMLYALRDPTNERSMKDFDSKEQKALEAEVWRKAQEARVNKRIRDQAAMSNKELKATQQKKLMKQLSADPDTMMNSQDQWRLDMIETYAPPQRSTCAGRCCCLAVLRLSAALAGMQGGARSGARREEQEGVGCLN